MLRRPALSALLALAAVAAPAWAAGSDTVTVRVLRTDYVVGERRFADASALAAHLRPLRARTIALDDCASGATAARVLAAVESLWRASEGLEIRALPATDPGCLYAQGAARRAGTVAVRPPDAGYLAVDRRGRSILP
jgi:hypothetical protein